MNSDWPRQTVVIPIRNEEKFISSTINFILNQDYPRENLEVIVVDGQSDDDTVKIVQEMAKGDSRLRLLNNPKRISSAARNIGAQNATGEIITFIDGHTYIDNNQLLKSVASLMEEKQVCVLSRPQFLETPDNDYFQQAVALARRSLFGHGLDSTIYTNNEKFVDPSSSGASYKKEVFEKIGFFDENFDAAEDVEFNYRVHLAGYKSFTSPKLAVHYYPRDNMRRLFLQMKRYGVGRFRLSKKHPGAMSSGTLAPALFVVGLPILIALSLTKSEFVYLLIALYGLYFVLNLLSSLAVALNNGLKYLPRLPLIYIAVHWGLGWGFVSEFARFIFRKK